MNPAQATSLLIGVCLCFCGTAKAENLNFLNYQGRIAVRGVNFDGVGQFKFALIDSGSTSTPVSRTATGTAVVTSGSITSVNLIDGGAGYTSTPAVTITGGGGNGAIVVALMNNGAVTGFSIAASGSGYNSPPTVTVSAPPPGLPTTVYQTFWSNDGSSVAGGEPDSPVSLPVKKGLFSTRLGDPAVANMAAIPDSVFQKSDLRLRIWFNDANHGWQQLSSDQMVSAAPYALRSGVANSIIPQIFRYSVMKFGALETPYRHNNPYGGAGGRYSLSSTAKRITAMDAWYSSGNVGVVITGTGSARTPQGTIILVRKAADGTETVLETVELKTVGSNKTESKKVDVLLDWENYNYFIDVSIDSGNYDAFNVNGPNPSYFTLSQVKITEER